MKKKIFGSLAILTIAVIVAFNVNINTKTSNPTSLLALANVEALADGEGTVSIPCNSCLLCKCTFSATLADGTIGSLTVDKAKNS